MNFTKILPFTLALFVNFVTPCQSAWAQGSVPAPQLWISPSNAIYFYGDPTATPGIYTNGPAYGTRADVPLFGDFDTIVAQITNQCPEIHLFPGVYYTSGGYTTSDGFTHSSPIGVGFKIRGSGIDVTIIRDQYSPATFSGQGAIFLGDPTDNIEISDLTADYGTPITGNVASRAGIFIVGGGCRVQRVKVTGIFGSLATLDEGFGIGIGNGSSSTNSLIEGCEVSGTISNYISAMVISGNGVMRHNSVYLPDLIGGAYTFAYASHLSIVQNYLYGGGLAVWADTGPVCTNILVAGNTFDNVTLAYYDSYGATVQNWRDVYFVKNTIHNATGDGVWLTPGTNGGTFTNLVVAKNMFISPYGNVTNYGLPVNVWGSIYDVNVFGNAWPTNTFDFHSGGYNNVDLTGEIYDAPPGQDYVFNQANAVGSLPTLICSSNSWPSGNQLNIRDSYVIVTSLPSSPQLILPLLALNFGYRPGRQVIIANTAPSGAVTVVPQSGQTLKVNGVAVSSLTLYGTNPPAQFISDNNNTWSQY
jgi:hypothetical protein